MKKIIIVSGIIVAIIVIIAVIFWQYIFIFIASRLENPARDQKLYTEALANGDIKICDDVAIGYVMSAASPRSNCYGAVIAKLADKNICDTDQIKNRISKDDCYSVVAGVTKDESLCSLMSEEKDSVYCYSAVAKAKNDSTLCGDINENAEFGGDKARCYGEVVRTTKDYSICKALKTPALSDICLGYYLEGSNITLDFCNKFQTEEGKNGCFLIVARQTKDPKICDKIQGVNMEYNKNECLLESK